LHLIKEQEKMGSSASKYFEIPKFFVFGEKGIFTGSASEKDFNYKVVPNVPKEGEKSLRAYIWAGDKCIDKSEGVEMKEFPLSEEGHKQMLCWLEEEYLKRPDAKPLYARQMELAREISENYVSLEDYMENGRGVKQEVSQNT